MDYTAASLKLTATVTAASDAPLVSGSQKISQVLNRTFENVDIAWAATADLGSSSTGVDITFASGVITGAAAPTYQVETATAAGTITTAGNATAIVTGAYITGSPVTVTFAVALSDTATAWATKARTALTANAAISAQYTVSGSGTSIVLTDKFNRATDSTLNIALADATSAGITEAATSTGTTAGVAGAILSGGAGEDLAGVALPSASSFRLIVITNQGPGQLSLPDISLSLASGGSMVLDSASGSALATAFTLVPSSGRLTCSVMVYSVD